MGILRFLRSIVNREVMGEEIVNQQEKIYWLSEKIFPDADLHDRLVGLWISRMRALHKDMRLGRSHRIRSSYPKVFKHDSK